ncbi:MAG: hypothetical protein ABI459_00760 [Deltaproteobacteria bacterium]
MKYLALILSILASPALAQSVEDCDWRAEAANVAEPWEQNSRTFANGDVRLAVIDVGEPAAGGYYLLVLSPPFGETGERQCRIVNSADSIGFAGLQISQIKADYDPKAGLIIRLPIASYEPDIGSVYDGRILRLTLNQATGDITTVIE